MRADFESSIHRKWHDIALARPRRYSSVPKLSSIERTRAQQTEKSPETDAAEG